LRSPMCQVPMPSTGTFSPVRSDRYRMSASRLLFV
jgi:hypothetical protein